MKHAKEGARAALSIVVGLLVVGGGCHRDTSLGLADSYVLYAPAVDAAGAALRSPAGLPVVAPLALEDVRAVPLEKQIEVGILGEIVRTDYLAKQVVRDVSWEGKSFPEPARTAAREPTIVVVGRGLPPLGEGLAFSTLVVDFATAKGARAIVKGLRAISDFEYELEMNQLNRRQAPDIESVYLMASPKYSFLRSSGVKELATFGGDIEALVPDEVARHLKERLSR